jgi:hypothetical protein
MLGRVIVHDGRVTLHELKPSQIFSFIPEHHAQRPDAQEKKKTACQTSIATHPRPHPERYTGTQVEIITTRPEGQAKRLHSRAARISIINQVGE